GRAPGDEADLVGHEERAGERLDERVEATHCPGEVAPPLLQVAGADGQLVARAAQEIEGGTELSERLVGDGRRRRVRAPEGPGQGGGAGACARDVVVELLLVPGRATHDRE